MWRWPNRQQINIARGVQSNWKVNPPASLFFEQTIWLATAVPSVLRTNWTRSSPLLCRCRSTTNSCLLPRAVPYRGRRLSVRWNTRRQLMLFYRKDGSIALPWTFEWHPVFSKLPYFLCFLYIPGSNLRYPVVRSADFQRSENTMNYNVGLSYSPRPWLSAQLGYEYESYVNKFADAGFEDYFLPDYDAHRVTLTLQLGY